MHWVEVQLASKVLDINNSTLNAHMWAYVATPTSNHAPLSFVQTAQVGAPSVCVCVRVRLHMPGSTEMCDHVLVCEFV